MVVKKNCGNIKNRDLKTISLSNNSLPDTLFYFSKLQEYNKISKQHTFSIK